MEEAREFNDLPTQRARYTLGELLQTPTSSEVQKQENEPSDAESKKTQPSSTFEKIVWLGTEDQLVYLFEELIAKKFIPDSVNIHAFVESCFLNKSGKPFNRKQLATVKQRVVNSGKPKKGNVLDNTLDNVLSRALQKK